MATNRNSTFQNVNPPIPQDQYGEAAETLFDPATGGLVAKRAVNIGTATVAGKTIKYGDEAVSISTAASTDTVATGNLTAAQPTVGTVVAGGTVSIALGSGQGVVEAQLTGTFSSGTTIIFEGTDDSGTTTNWFTTFGQNTTVANAPNISSVAGAGPYLVRIPAGGYQQIRVRASALTGGDNVAVRLIGSVAGTGIDGTVAVSNTVAENLTQVNGSAISNTNPVPSQDIRQSGYVALSSPPATTNAGTETILTFSQQVSGVTLYNGTSANFNYAFDATVTAGSLVLPPGYQLDKPKKVTAVHVLTAAAQNVNGNSAANIILLGEL